MPDGRIVEFPSSTSKEEIDELAKRIALGAVELLPGARVIGWEPVEGPFLYEEAIATIPTVKGKLDALANAVSILRSQINALQVQLESERAANNAGFRSTDKTLNNHADSFDALAAQVAYLAQQEQMRKPQPDVDDLKRELDKFKEVACPILRTANLVGETHYVEYDGADFAVFRSDELEGLPGEYRLIRASGDGIEPCEQPTDE